MKFEITDFEIDKHNGIGSTIIQINSYPSILKMFDQTQKIKIEVLMDDEIVGKYNYYRLKNITYNRYFTILTRHIKSRKFPAKDINKLIVEI